MEKQTYSYDEAYKASLQYFNGDELAARVWVNKYAVKDSFGNIYEKSPEDMHWRIANEVARIEAKYPNALSSEELFGLLDHFKYIVPQGSPMTGIGNDYQVASLSNCFVIGLEGSADSYGAIIKIDEEAEEFGFDRLGELVKEYKVEKFVVGLPKNMNNTEGPRVEASKAYGDKIKEILGIPVDYQDERLTTVQAERMLVEQADVSRGKRKKVIDKLAAQLNLQNYLDRMF